MIHLNSPSPTSSSLSPRACCIISPVVLFLVIQTAWGELINEGYIGGPIHGMNHEDTKRVSNQTGHFVNLLSPKSLAIKLPKNRLNSGESMALSASILWDDFSVDDLPYKLSEWEVSDERLVINDGVLKAPALAERISVKLVVRAHGMSSTSILFVLADKTLAEDLKHSNLPVALINSQELGAQGWKRSNWLGTFYDSGSGWIYHTEHGWLYIVEADASSVWFWEEEQQWLWTGHKVYPHLYRNRDNSWLYFMENASVNKKVFFNYKSEVFEQY